MKRVSPAALAAVVSAAFVLLGTRDASAQKKKSSEPITLGAIEITARPTRPSAVVELGKLFPEPEIAKMRQAFLTKIEEALIGEPF